MNWASCSCQFLQNTKEKKKQKAFFSLQLSLDCSVNETERMRRKDCWRNDTDYSLSSLLEIFCAYQRIFMFGYNQTSFLVFLCYSLTDLLKQLWHLGKPQVVLKLSCSKSIKQRVNTATDEHKGSRDVYSFVYNFFQCQRHLLIRELDLNRNDIQDVKDVVREPAQNESHHDTGNEPFWSLLGLVSHSAYSSCNTHITSANNEERDYKTCKGLQQKIGHFLSIRRIVATRAQKSTVHFFCLLKWNDRNAKGNRQEPNEEHNQRNFFFSSVYLNCERVKHSQ